MADYTLSARITGDSSSYEKAVDTAKRKTEGLSKTTSGIGSKLASGLSSGLKVAAGAIAGVTTAMGAAVGAAVRVGSEFESQMSRVQAISGATSDEFQALREQALQLGADTAFSASSAAEGMENLASAGFTTTEIMEAMPGLLDLAAASGEDLALSSDIAASTLRGFGLEASEAGHVADVLAENANRTNSSVADTGEAMKYVAPLARSAGISLEETAAAIGIMANAGIQGSQAGTTLRGAISRLSKPTDEMKTAMEQLGISFYDSDGKMKSLSDQVAMLKSAMSGMTDEQKNNYLVTLYGQEALSGMMALVNEGDESLKGLTTSFENCDGSASDAAATMQDNFSGAIEQLKGSAETLGIKIFDSISEPLKNMAQAATDGLNSLTTAFQNNGMEGLITEGGRIVTSLLLGISQRIPDIIPVAIDIIQSLLANITMNLPMMVNSGIGIIQSFISGIVQLLPTLGTFALEIITEIYNGLSANLPVILQTGYDLLNNLVSGFVSNIPTVLPQILSFIQDIGNKLSEAAPTLIQKGFELLSKLVEGIVSALPILIARVPEIVSTFANIINDNFPTILAKGAELLWQLIQGILSAIPTLIANIPKIVTAIVDVIQAFNWLSLGKNIITFFKDGIMGMVGAVKNAGKNIFDAIRNAIKNLPQNLKNIGKTAISGLGNVISSMVGFIKNSALNIVNGIVSTISSIPGKMVSIGKNIIQGIWNGISDMTGWIIDKIGGFASSVVDSICNFFGIHSPSTLMRDEVGKFMALGLGIGFENNIPVNDMKKSLGASVDQLSDYDVRLGGHVDMADAVMGSRDMMRTYQSGVGMALGRTTQHTEVNFYGNYQFSNRDDVDYFMNQAAIRLRRQRA